MSLVKFEARIEGEEYSIPVSSIRWTQKGEIIEIILSDNRIFFKPELQGMTLWLVMKNVLLESETHLKVW